MKRVAVVGAGLMGHGIGEIFAMAGLKVVLIDVKGEILSKAMTQIRWSLGKLAEKGRISKGEAEAAKSRISSATNLEKAVSGVDFVVEAVPENIELKKRVFTKLDKSAPEKAILSSNTSCLSITEMSEITERSDKVVGMHFFNPAVLMELVEVIKGEHTSDETVSLTVNLAKRLGKRPIIIRKDVRGFVVNRVLLSVLNEAFWVFYNGEAPIEVVDSMAKYTAGFPQGMFKLADVIGLDVIYNILRVMETDYKTVIKVCPLINHLVEEKKFGQKSGRGFYNWTVGRPEITPRYAEKIGVKRFYAVTVNAAAWLIHEGVAEPDDIDMGLKLGAGWPSGPCELADRLGLDSILKMLNELHEKYCEEMYKPSPLLVEYVSKVWLGRKTNRGFYEYG